VGIFRCGVTHFLVQDEMLERCVTTPYRMLVFCEGRGRAVTTEIRRLLPLSESWYGHVFQWRGEESTECQLPPRLSRARPRLVPIQLLTIVHIVLVLLALRDSSHCFDCLTSKDPLQIFIQQDHILLCSPLRFTLFTLSDLFNASQES
jgi:hypothetical protein